MSLASFLGTIRIRTDISAPGLDAFGLHETLPSDSDSDDADYDPNADSDDQNTKKGRKHIIR